MMRSTFRSGIARLKGRTLVAAFSAVILSTVLLVQASTAVAATLSEDMVQASKDACVNLARRRGFTVEQVINAQPVAGDSASVVLKLMKAGEPYEFKCGFSQAINHFVAPAPAPAATVAQKPAAAVNPVQAPAKVEPRQEIRRERAVVVTRDRNRQADASTIERNRGRFNAAWLLPLLLLPLAALLFRKRDEEVATARVTNTPMAATTIVEAILRNQDNAVEVRSGAGMDHNVMRTIPAGSRVRLSGRYENDWAELAESGWISISALTADPRKTAIRS